MAKFPDAFLPCSYFLRSVLSFSTAMRASKLHHRRAKDASVLTILEKGKKIVSSSVEFPLRLTQSEVDFLASASICDLAKVRALLGSSVAPCHQTSRLPREGGIDGRSMTCDALALEPRLFSIQIFVGVKICHMSLVHRNLQLSCAYTHSDCTLRSSGIYIYLGPSLPILPVNALCTPRTVLFRIYGMHMPVTQCTVHPATAMHGHMMRTRVYPDCAMGTTTSRGASLH
jgi:hypothetical protein